jgi:hypothetical protein
MLSEGPHLNGNRVSYISFQNYSILSRFLNLVECRRGCLVTNQGKDRVIALGTELIDEFELPTDSDLTTQNANRKARRTPSPLAAPATT